MMGYREHGLLLRASPILPEVRGAKASGKSANMYAARDSSDEPALFGIPLKYLSLITLALQNALLTLIMHHSRVSIPKSQMYSAAAAVLLNELLKGSISLAIAFSKAEAGPKYSRRSLLCNAVRPGFWLSRFRRVGKEVFSRDCWKLSIPAILYVIQNNLQYVAASNLDAATFQVSYQMKILTTAFFSVVMLKRRLIPMKWAALLALAMGVAVVQLQTGFSGSRSSSGNVSAEGQNATGSVAEAVIAAAHDMNALKGLIAVIAACFTSGLAGVYFEMVLKGSTADLWIRNVQLSLFSLLPALVPIVFSHASTPTGPVWSFTSLFANFGFWAYATVFTQVLGGLITAIVIKYADNIAKGFATSLSIVISFLASVALFDYRVTPAFVVGAGMVLGATWLYNQPDPKKDDDKTDSGLPIQLPVLNISVSPRMSPRSSRNNSAVSSPILEEAPAFGFSDEKNRSSLSNVVFSHSASSSGSGSGSSSLSLSTSDEELTLVPLIAAPTAASLDLDLEANVDPRPTYVSGTDDPLTNARPVSRSRSATPPIVVAHTYTPPVITSSYSLAGSAVGTPLSDLSVGSGSNSYFMVDRRMAHSDEEDR